MLAPELKKLYIGLTSRTNELGAEQLAKIAFDNFNHRAYFISTPPSFLHLKGEVTFQARPKGDHVFVVSEEIVDYFANSGCRLIVTPREERFGANCILVGDTAMSRYGAMKTESLLSKAGYRLCQIDISQFMLIDGAITCLWKKLPLFV